MTLVTHRLGELAARLELQLEGDSELEIRGLAGLGDASAGDLSFVTGPRYAAAFARSAAGAVLAPPDFDVGDRPVLRSLAPYADFARVVEMTYPRPDPKPGVHSTAVIGEEVRLGEDVWIGAYVVVGDGSEIGARTRIHPHVTVYPNVSIGSDCEIHSGAHLREAVCLGDRVAVQSGAVIGSEGFAFVYTAEGKRVRVLHRSGVTIGNDADIGANTAIDASHPGQGHHGHGRATTWIGNGVKIDNLVQVGHGSSVGDGSTLCAQVGLAGSTGIGRNVTFAGKSSSAGHLEVGDGALIGGQCAIRGDVEPGGQLLGYPGIERRLWARITAASKRLPDLLKRVRRIENKLGID